MGKITMKLQNYLKVQQNRGFTLVEVLIAVLVLSIGLLGLASLQAASLRNNYSSYMRTQATLLANDMADRIRANPTGATAGSYNSIGPTGLPTTAPTSCLTTGCSTAQMALFDIAAWGTLLDSRLPGGTGSVVGTVGGTVFTVTVMWDDNKTGATGTTCGGGTTDLTCFAITLMP